MTKKHIRDDTVLHIAARYGRTELLAEIPRLSPFMAGAENNKGETPLHEACRMGHDKILMMLMETDPWVASKPQLQELDDGENATFLHVAASEGHIAIVRKLLEMHPNVAQKLNKNGYSPLHHACSRGHLEITAILLGHDPERAFRFNRTGYALVHLAIINGSSKLLREFVSGFRRHKSFYQPDKNVDTSLHLAVSGGRHQIAEYIIKEGGGGGRAQINYQNFRGDNVEKMMSRNDF
ncbi:26S proteasome regulatory complex, subunit PSMD10 [Handroanthus impetiginosus]|uniref:26S proteasome regulatory complex, subunit PSMD10 n=1 Tax=Handroanthus impetiginosus TaxID=429701 RepID=A0A2G9G7W4_9LAMI|nr:26S proteasome regulatory complex, subunit PSMD10 [Handroanthus impetiginosus]